MAIWLLTIFLAFVSVTVEAAMPGMYQLRHALDPIILVFQAACYPVGVMLMFWGVIRWALDDPNGLKLLRKGAVLIIAAYWIPWLADLVSQIGEQSAPIHLSPNSPSGK